MCLRYKLVMKSTLYEVFHSGTKKQTRIISDNNFTYRNIIKIVNKFIKTPQKILDVGCGAGTMSLYLANKGNDVVGIDISHKAIKAGKESAKYLGLTNISFGVMEFPQETPKEKFDIITCFEVLEHLEKDSLAIRKIFSLLNPGGFVFFSVPSLNAPLNRLKLTKDFDRNVGHLRRYLKEDLTKMIKNQGFDVVETSSTEGIIRNFLFVNPYAGKLVRFIKFFISDIVTFIDDLSLPVFGYSNFFIIAKKPL